MYFTVLKNVVAQPMNMFVLEFMLLYCEIDSFFCIGAFICVLRIGVIPFCTGVYFISVLGYILLYWCIFYCTDCIYTHTTDEYVCVLRYRLQ